MSRPQAGFEANIATTSTSATMTQTTSQARPDHIRRPPSTTLRLRADTSTPQQRPRENARRVQWSEDVVNNEGMGKKSSKVCCIYHKPRAVGESSDEDSSDSSSDEESDNSDDGAAKPISKRKDKCSHGGGRKHMHGEDCSGGGEAQAKGSKKAANAYERLPKKT